MFKKVKIDKSIKHLSKVKRSAKDKNNINSTNKLVPPGSDSTTNESFPINAQGQPKRK